MTVFDGDDAVVTQIYTVNITGMNDAPVITSNGGGASASISMDSGTTAVTTVTSTDVDGGTPSYSITGGADMALFSIVAATGVLTFTAPSLAGIYVVDITVNDTFGGTDVQTITVTVLPALSIVGPNTIVEPGVNANPDVVAEVNDQTYVVTVAGDGTGNTLSFEVSSNSGGAWTAVTVNGSPTVLSNGVGATPYTLNLDALVDTGALDITNFKVRVIETFVASGSRNAQLAVSVDNFASPPVISTLAAANALNAWNYSFGGTGAEAGSTVNYSINDGVNPAITGMVNANGSGVWTVTGVNIAGLNDGNISLTVTQTDIYGNVSLPALATVIKNTDNVIVVGVGDVTPGNKSAYRISGYAKPGATVQVTVNTKNSLSVVADAITGAWTTTINFGTYSAANGTTLPVTIKQTPVGGSTITTSNSDTPAIAYRTTSALAPTGVILDVGPALGTQGSLSAFTISGTAAGATTVGMMVNVVLTVNGRTVVLQTPTTAGGAYSLTVNLSTYAMATNTVTAWVYYRDNLGRQGQTNTATATAPLTSAEENSILEDFRSMQDADGVIDWAMATQKPVASDDLAWADFMDRPSLSDSLSIEVDAFRA